MKITNVKSMVAKLFTVGLLAGAFAIAAPTKAEAQVAVGVRVGPVAGYVGPRYHRPYAVAPAPFYGGFYGRPAFYGRPYYGRPYWDHRRFYR